jgi:hypothetical protein
MVVTIIALVSTVGVMWFLSTAQNQAFQSELSTLLSKIENYEKNIKTEISDYEFEFYVWKDFYTHSYNKNFSQIKQTLTFSGENLVLKNNFTGTWYFIIEEHRNNKFFNRHILSSTGILDLWNVEKWEYSFYSQVNETKLNPIFVSFYSNFNFDEWWENIFLNSLSWSSYTWAILKWNITEKRQYFINSSQTGTLQLEFEKNWKNYNLDFNN